MSENSNEKKECLPKTVLAWDLKYNNNKYN